MNALLGQLGRGQPSDIRGGFSPSAAAAGGGGGGPASARPGPGAVPLGVGGGWYESSASRERPSWGGESSAPWDAPTAGASSAMWGSSESNRASGFGAGPAVSQPQRQQAAQSGISWIALTPTESCAEWLSRQLASADVPNTQENRYDLALARLRATGASHSKDVRDRLVASASPMGSVTLEILDRVGLGQTGATGGKPKGPAWGRGGGPDLWYQALAKIMAEESPSADKRAVGRAAANYVARHIVSLPQRVAANASPEAIARLDRDASSLSAGQIVHRVDAIASAIEHLDADAAFVRAVRGMRKCAGRAGESNEFAACVQHVLLAYKAAIETGMHAARSTTVADMFW